MHATDNRIACTTISTY